MALNISEGQFVTNPVDPSQAIQHVQQTLWQRNMQNQRLELMKEMRRNQVTNELDSETDPTHYYTGSVYDPVITKNLQQAKQIGIDVAMKGGDVATVQQAIGPLMDRIKNYSLTAKAVNAQIDKQVQLMRDNKLDVGYRLGDAVMGARQSALMKQDQDGNWVPKDPSEVNLSQNFLASEISAHPDQYTTNEALQNYAQHSGKSTRQNEVLVTHPNGNSVKKSVEVIGANWEQPEADANGNIQMVPMYDHATNNGEVLHHTVTGPDGKQTEEPIRLFDETNFDRMMQNPGIADYIKGQTMQHIGEYKDANGKPVTLGSPVAKLIARGIAYKELASAGNSTVKSIQENKVSPAQVSVNLYGNKGQQAYDSAMGRYEAKSDAGDQGLTPEKTNAIQALSRVWNNDPNYMDGPLTKVGEQNVIDITSRMPKGGLQYTNQFGKKEPYQGVYYDPAKREVIVKKAGGYEHYTEAQAGQLAASIAGPNGVPLNSVKGTLSNAGWSGGKFSNPVEAPDIEGKAKEAQKTIIQAGIDRTIKSITENGGSSSGLKDASVADGKVVKVSKNTGWFNNTKYDVTVQVPDGTIKTIPIKNDDDLKQYILGGQDIQSKSNASGVIWKK